MERLGPYQIVRRLGTGGSAEVFLARGPTPSGEAELALKLILPHLAEDGGHRAMLLREAQMVMPLRHPNVVEIYDVGEIDGRTYLAMEYLSGWPLNAFLRALRDKGASPSLGEAAHLIREAALGLHHAHEATDEAGQKLGIVHRDVSPHNLMLSRDGHLKVVDFGLARATHASATQTGGLKGKLRYMPPEQLRSEPLDRRVDVFALGAILWDLALGTPLHPGPTEADIFQQALFLPQPHPDEVATGLPRAFVDVLQQAVAREADRRFPTAQALADALAPFVTSDAPEKIAELAAKVLAPAPAAAGEQRRLTREEVPAWDAPPAQDPRIAPSLSKMPRVRRTTLPPRSSGSSPPVRPPPLERDTLPRPALPRPEVPDFDTTPSGRPLEPDEPSITAADALPRRRVIPKVAQVIVIALLAGGAIVLVLRGLGVLAPEAQAVDRPSATAIGDAAPPLQQDTPSDPPSEDVAAQNGPEDPTPEKQPARTGRATLVLTSDRPALARTGGRDLGMTPVTVRLTSGRHRLVLESLDGKTKKTVDVDVPRSGTVKRHVAFAR